MVANRFGEYGLELFSHRLAISLFLPDFSSSTP